MSDMLVRLDTLADAHAEREALRRDGVIIRRIAPYEASVLRRFIEATFTAGWSDEVGRCFIHQPPACFVAISGGDIIGFAVYECTRRGFFGPIGVAPGHRERGIGRALLLTALAAMKEMDYKYAIIGWVGPDQFYARHAGATVIEGSGYDKGEDWLLK